MIHHQVEPFLSRRDGAVSVRLWIRSADPPLDLWLRSEPDNQERLAPMTLVDQVAGEPPLRVYEAVLVPNPAEPFERYAFKVLWPDRQQWLDAFGQRPRMPPRERCFRLFRGDGPPDWVPDQVFYQIFPERFRAGTPGRRHPRVGQELRPGDGPIRSRPWGEAIDPQRPNTEHFGGDLPGVRQALDYLEDLGVTALYLNPIFTSPSVHRYDTEDYEHVDPALGGDEALVALRRASAERGMRLVLDGVFNHTSDTHPWFDRFGQHPGQGAYQGPDAPHRGAYRFSDPDDPESYFCWLGARTLPVLDFSDPAVRAYFFGTPDGIVQRWLRPPFSADGWRLDVAHMIGEGAGAANNAGVLGALRRAAREARADAYIVGEHFFDATRWLQGDLEDGAMNYFGFGLPVRAFLAGKDVNYHPVRIDGVELDAWLTDARCRIPYANALCQLNLLDSHDTTRFLTLVDGDRASMRLALLLLFVYPGVPCIYYGDEIGMAGENDPFNRACFDWDPEHWDQDLRALVQRLAHLRRSHAALCRGAYQTLAAGGDCLVFARMDPGETLILAVNRGDDPVRGLRLDLDALPWLPAHWCDLLDETLRVPAEAVGSLDLPAKGARLLRGTH